MSSLGAGATALAAGAGARLAGSAGATTLFGAGARFSRAARPLGAGARLAGARARPPGAGARSGTRPGAGPAPGAPAPATRALATRGVVSDLQGSAVQLCPVQLPDDVLHVLVAGELHHTLVPSVTMGISKCHLASVPHEILEVLP